MGDVIEDGNQGSPELEKEILLFNDPMKDYSSDDIVWRFGEFSH